MRGVIAHSCTLLVLGILAWSAGFHAGRATRQLGVGLGDTHQEALALGIFHLFRDRPRLFRVVAPVSWVIHTLWHYRLHTAITGLEPIVSRHRREPSILQLRNISIAVGGRSQDGVREPQAGGV